MASTGPDALTADLAGALSRVSNRVREHRRHIHRRPELGWCEFATTAYVRDELARIGISNVAWGADLLRGVSRMGFPKQAVTDAAGEAAAGWGVAKAEIDAMHEHGTGVIAEIAGNQDGPTVAVRVDMDGLPIGESERSDHLPRRDGFASEVAGVMHACGHDGHVAIGLALAEVLASLSGELRGKVRLLFQPAEEGTRGGMAFVDAGLLRDVQHLLSCHISGYTGLRTGLFSPGVTELLSTIKFDVSLHGRAAHYASAPHKGRSALNAASAIALLSQTLPRKPGARALINVGRIEAGTARNVVPEHGELKMEVRAETDELVNDLFESVSRLVRSVGDGLEVETEVNVVGRTPAADSDPSLAEIVSAAGSEMGLQPVDGLTMEASDDASAMMRAVQESGGSAVYAKVGSDLAGGNHTPTYDFDERSLMVGVELLARSVFAVMRRNQ